MQQSAAIEKWYAPEPAPDDAPAPPIDLAISSDFAFDMWALGVIVTLAGLIPIVLFVAWALAPHALVGP